MSADPQRGGSRGRVVWLILLAAWVAGAVWAFAAIAEARARLRDIHPFVTEALADSERRARGALRGWSVSLRLCDVLLALLILLVVWAAVLLFRRQPHPRQWATIMVAAVVVALSWLLFAGFGAPLAEARRYFAPEEAFAAQLLVGAGALLLFVLALVRTRSAPEPVDPQQDRYHIANYSQFNKPAAGSAGGALAEARARADSVLPVDDGEA
jgi:drug/metabolite transporter (DMT)-like permease